MAAGTSGLSFIKLKHSSNPALMLKEWLNEGKSYGAASSLMNLATATKQGKVSNRTVVIREITSEGSLAFLAQASSSKIKDIQENPQVAATVLLTYHKDDVPVSRQIRVSGAAEKLSKQQCKVYFERERLHAKIRAWICQDNGPADWNELKVKHDELLKEVVENKKVLEMPDSQVAYKIVPQEIDFYHALGNEIADRMLFRLDENGDWNHQRMKA